MASAEPSERQQILIFGVRRSIRYHMRRSGFFDGIGTFISVLNAVCGTSAIATLVGKNGTTAPVVLAAVVGAGSVLNLGLGLARRARLHNDLAKRFVEIEKRITRAGTCSEEQLCDFEAERLSVQADEPPIKRTLDSLCHNELAKSMGFGSDHIYKIGVFRRVLANFISFDCTSLKTFAQIEAQKQKRLGPQPEAAK